VPTGPDCFSNTRNVRDRQRRLSGRLAPGPQLRCCRLKNIAPDAALQTVIVPSAPKHKRPSAVWPSSVDPRWPHQPTRPCRPPLRQHLCCHPVKRARNSRTKTAHQARHHLRRPDGLLRWMNVTGIPEAPLAFAASPVRDSFRAEQNTSTLRQQLRQPLPLQRHPSPPISRPAAEDFCTMTSGTACAERTSADGRSSAASLPQNCTVPADEDRLFTAAAIPVV